MCGGPELGRVAPPGSIQPVGIQPEVIASSVVADDGTKKKTSIQVTSTSNSTSVAVSNNCNHIYSSIQLHLCMYVLHLTFTHYKLRFS